MVSPVVVAIVADGRGKSAKIEIIDAARGEAAGIAEKSPRGSAALSRLIIQKLMIDLGENGKDINADIASIFSECAGHANLSFIQTANASHAWQRLRYMFIIRKRTFM